MKKNDLIILLLLAMVSLFFIGFNKFKSSQIEESESQVYAEVYVEQKLYKIIPLEEDYEETFEINTSKGRNIIKVHDGGAEIIEADCPDHVCESTGFINEAGQIIVCLPHQVIVEIKGEGKTKIDAVSN